MKKSILSLLVSCAVLVSCAPDTPYNNGYQIEQNMNEWAMERQIFPSSINCYRQNEICVIFQSQNEPAIASCENRMDDGETLITQCRLTKEGETFVGTDNITK